VNDQTVQEILARLDALASKLNVTSQQLWAILVRQAYAEAYVDLAYAGVFAVIMFTAIYWLHRSITYGRSTEKAGYDSDWPALAVAGAIVFSIIVLISAAVVICDLNDAVLILLNPQYWAYKHLFS
jgi:hypothetical protein